MITKEAAYKKIAELVKRFDEQLASYKSPDYNETLTRRDFIDPFFKALGWDIDNEEGYAEAYREVIHEDKVKVSGATKAPDYSFRLVGGKRLFFVEAKKPSVAIKDDILPAYQVRRYGWSAKLSISIITDFEEFAIYDCTKKPIPSDKASVARIEYITYNDYLKKFDFIWDTFSKEHVLKGSFDKFIQGTANKKGTATVDKEFLQSLDSWRTYLATSISWNNKDLDEDEINFAVQQIIDRIIFLRIAEDRSVEPYGNLKDALKQGDYYQNLFSIFKEADDKYNSGLFDFKKDQISKNLKIDNKVIKTIITELYYPESPYEFSVLSVEILGSAYEQFLGKVIRITPSHHAKIEEKPEVRKAGGVYYTPQYIVEYIVKNTVGKLIDGKTPKEISKIKIVDPACGSGSFLIGAYQYLLDFHKNYYSDNGKPSKGKKESPLTPAGHLTTAEKKRILLNNIFGVDIDVNAVEVTKLSLLIKCMEGETSASIAYQLSMFHERVLPTLDNNIKDGNSLIDSRYYKGQLGFEPLAQKKIKPFDWNDKFPDVFNQGGFDVVIGNPPYVEFKVLDKEIKNAIERFYESSEGKYDLFIPFIEKGIKLLKDEGLFSFIVPSMFTKRDYGQAIRKFITNNSKIEHLVYFGDFQVFDQVTIFPFIFIFSKNKSKPKDKTDITLFPTQKGLKHIIVNASLQNDKSDEYSLKYKIESKKLNENPWNIANDSITDFKSNLVSNPNTIKLQDITEYIFVGIQSGKDEVFFVTKETIKEYKLEKEIVIPIFKGRDILRYQSNWTGTYIIYPYNKKTNSVIPEKELKSNFPNVYSYLSENRNLLKGRDYFDKSSKEWYELWCERNFQKFKQIKIVNAEISSDNRFYLDNDGFLGNTKTFSTVLNVEWKDQYYYVLGLLNSNVLEFFHKQISVPKAGGFFEYKTQFLNLYPIRKIDFSNKIEKDKHDEISKLVELIIQLHQEKKSLNLQTKIEQVQTRIDFTEKRINEIVYELYDLTPDEIKIVKEK